MGKGDRADMSLNVTISRVTNNYEKSISVHLSNTASTVYLDENMKLLDAVMYLEKHFINVIEEDFL